MFGTEQFSVRQLRLSERNLIRALAELPIFWTRLCQPLLLALLLCIGKDPVAWGQSPPPLPPLGSEASTSTGAMLDELLVELRVGRYARSTVLALSDGVHVLLPVEETLDLLELRHESQEDSLVHAILEPQGVEITLQPWRGVARREGHALHGLSAVVGWVPYADSQLLAQWLQIQAQVDMSGLIVHLQSVDALPIGQRLRRERMRMAGLGSRSSDDYDIRLDSESAWLQGFVMDWNAQTPGAHRVDSGIYQLGAGSSLAGGGLELLYRENLQAQTSEFEGLWSGVWPERRHLRQMRLGRTQSTSPREFGLRGITLSNSPFQRNLDFGERVIRGQLPPNWEVEVYSYGQLVAFGTVDDSGEFEFNLPLDYGQNALEIRGYGPHGETKILERADRVDWERLPDGAVEYGASAGECPEGECSSAYNVDLRHGFHDWWTLRAGFDHFEGTADGGLTHSYAALSGGAPGGWQFRLASAYRAQHELRLGFEPNLRWRSEVSWFRYDASVQEPIWQPKYQRSKLAWSLLTRPWRRWRSLFVHSDIQRRSGVFGEYWRTEFGLRQNVMGVRAHLRWNESWQGDTPWNTRQSTLQSGFSLILPSRGLGPLSRAFVRSDLRLDLSSTQSDELSISLAPRFVENLRLEIGAHWYRATEETVWSLALSSVGPFAHWNSYSTHGEGRDAWQTMAEGSVVYNEGAQRFEAHGLRSRGRGGLQGTVYEDRNANGIQDPTEPGVPGIRVLIGHEMGETDEHGRYAAWQLLPFNDTLIEVDVESLRNPLLIPAFDRAATLVTPNGFATVDIPLLNATELSGNVWFVDGDNRAPVGNLKIRLEGEERGRVYEGRTFSDGELYLTGLAPDSYRVVIDPALLARARMQPLQTETVLEIPTAGSQEGPVEFELLLTKAQ